MRTIRTLTMSLMLIGCLAMQAGCLAVAAAGAAAGTVLYVRGELKGNVVATPQEAVAATEKAFADLGLAQASATASGLDGKVTGKTAEGTNVTVTIRREAENLTQIRIRVGVFGNEAYSRSILDKINANL
jgi:hypothetical protein